MKTKTAYYIFLNFYHDLLKYDLGSITFEQFENYCKNVKYVKVNALLQDITDLLQDFDERDNLDASSYQQFASDLIDKINPKNNISND